MRRVQSRLLLLCLQFGGEPFVISMGFVAMIVIFVAGPRGENNGLKGGGGEAIRQGVEMVRERVKMVQGQIKMVREQEKIVREREKMV